MSKPQNYAYSSNKGRKQKDRVRFQAGLKYTRRSETTSGSGSALDTPTSRDYDTESILSSSPASGGNIFSADYSEKSDWASISGTESANTFPRNNENPSKPGSIDSDTDSDSLCHFFDFKDVIEPIPYDTMYSSSTCPTSQLETQVQPRQPILKEDDFNIFDRMSTKYFGKLEYLEKITKKPKIIKPEPDLPIWKRIPLENKIPMLSAPKDSITYSRGFICQQLIQGRKNGFQEDSFQAYEDKAVDLTYNALHDPHAKSYLRKPFVHRLLMKQGLVTRAGKVKCTLQDFNKYRAYLNNLHCADLQESLDKIQKKRADLRNMKASVDEAQNKKRALLHQQKIKRAREKARQIRKGRERRLMELLKMREERERRIQEEADQKALEKILQIIEKDHTRKFKLKIQQMDYNEKCSRLYASLEEKERQFLERMLNRRAESEYQNQEMAKQWFESWDNYEERHATRDWLAKVLKEKIILRAEKRQDRIGHIWTSVLKTAASISTPEEYMRTREAWIAKKYFNFWKYYTFGRAPPPEESKLKSSWEDDVQSIVQDIKEKSAIERIGDHGDVGDLKAGTRTSSCSTITVSDSEDLGTNDSTEEKKPRDPVKYVAAFTRKVLTKNAAKKQTAEMNLHLTARAVLKNMITQKAQEESSENIITRKVQEESFDLKQHSLEVKPEKDTSEDEQLGDWKNVNVKSSGFSTVNHRTGNKLISPKPVERNLPNTPGGDWQKPSKQNQRSRPKGDESIVAVHSVERIEPQPRRMFRSNQSRGMAELRRQNFLDKQSSTNRENVEKSKLNVSLDGIKNIKSGEIVVKEGEIDSDASDSSLVLGMRKNKDTIEALRKHHETELSFLRSRPSRSRLVLVGDTSVADDPVAKVEKYLFDISQREKEKRKIIFPVLSDPNFNRTSGTTTLGSRPSLPNFSGEPVMKDQSRVVSAESIFASPTSYTEFVSEVIQQESLRGSENSSDEDFNEIEIMKK